MHRALWLGLAACLLLGLPAQASTARFLDVTTLVHRADAVFLAEVLQRDSFWQGPKIYTLARLRVHQTWVGEAPADGFIDVLTHGGQVGDIGQEVGGAARLPLNGTLVLHLVKASTGEFLPVGMAQGVWQLALEQAQKPAGLLDLRKVRIFRPGVDRLVGDPGEGPQTVEQLHQAVREACLGLR
jgi:hypothetical protein